MVDQIPTAQVPYSADSLRPRTAPRVLAALIAVLGIVVVYAVWSVFVNTARGQTLDDMALGGSSHGQATLWPMAQRILEVAPVVLVVVGIAIAVGVPAFRRRWLLMGQLIVFLIGANVTTQVLKDGVFDRPELISGWTGSNSLPSGHTTVAASAAVALMFALPRRWRPLLAIVGMVWAGATGISTMVGGWHRPSDVVAAMFVVLAWGALICALTSRRALDTPDLLPTIKVTQSTTAVATLAYAIAGITGGLSVITAWDLEAGQQDIPLAYDLTAYASGVLAVMAATLTVFATLLLLRQYTARALEAPGGYPLSPTMKGVTT
ncbi:MAG: phosphatase PAP2 family protein [Cellulomonadaceae bacterium]|nr:phosphatase PAP2 family protein [Cellulomonadaceae bacterium]